MRNHRILAAALFVSVLFPSLVFAAKLSSTVNTQSHASDAAVLVLRIVNSARAAGMGNCVVNLADEDAPLYNPGALGVFHLKRYIGMSLPLNSEWLPEVMGSIKLRSVAFSGGYAIPLGNPKSGIAPRVALAAAYSRVKLSFGSVNLGSSEPAAYDKADCFTAAFAFDYHLRLGIGYTRKDIKSQLSALGEDPFAADAEAADYGILVELPIVRLLRSESAAAYELTPSFAYVKANDGEDIKYFDVFNGEPMPKMSRTGFALKFASGQSAKKLVSIILAYEIENDLVNSNEKVNKQGIEIGLFDALYARLGNVNDDDGQLNYTTYGFGLSLRGIINALSPRNDIKQGSGIFNRIEANLDYSRYEGGDYPAANNEFVQLRLSI